MTTTTKRLEDEQEELPFCQREYDGEKNRCYFTLGGSSVDRCVYCGAKRK